MMIIPLYYEEPDGTRVMHNYYGKLLLDITTRAHLEGTYGLTGAMLHEALTQWGACLGEENQLVFTDDRRATLFLLRWS